MIPLSERFSPPAIWTSLGQITGLVGMAAFAVSLILSVRVSTLEDFFGGMNRVYIAHHIIGGISFILLMIHPLLLMMSYLRSSWHFAALFLLPGADWAKNLGIAGLLTMMSLLILTYYIELPYELWRYTHKYLGAAFFAGGLHSFYISSDMNSGPLRIYMFYLSAFGMLCYVYRTVLGKFFVPRFLYEVRNVVRESTDTIDLILAPAGKRVMNFVPGQFVFVTFQGKGVHAETHPFSISSPPVAQGFRLSIKTLGDYTGWLSTIPVGTRASIEGPYGRFSYAFNPNRSYIWIGGGIGITPFVSMAYTVHSGECQVDIFYCTRDAREAIYMPTFSSIQSQNPYIRVFPWFSKEKGRLTGEQIARISGAIRTKDIFICGPPIMMHTLKKQLMGLGVKPDHIHTEEFGML